MQPYHLYQRYVAQFGHTFSEELMTDRSWKAAQVLMSRALDEGGDPVTDTDIRQLLTTQNSQDAYF